MCVQLIELSFCPVLEQLQIEEALLRNDDQNWLLINVGSAPAIVMGISGEPEELVHLEQLNCPLVRRYSGGGTVVVDANTIFVTFIGNKSWLDCSPFPRSIMQWSMQFYSHIPGLELRENDYVVADHKFGGNAQSITKDRFVHHSTLLWDYTPEKMAMLKMPKRCPDYREGRGHLSFLGRLKDLVGSQDDVVGGIKERVRSSYGLELGSIEGMVEKPHRRATRELVPCQESLHHKFEKKLPPVGTVGLC